MASSTAPKDLPVKLSPAQAAVLAAASDRSFLDYHAAARVGGNGRTLSGLVAAGLLVKNGYPDGSSDWSITDAGRQARAGATTNTKEAAS